MASLTAMAWLACTSVRAQAVVPAPPLENAVPAVQLWNSGQLLERGHMLLQKASQGSGSEVVTLTREPTQLTMLTARTRSGGAEMHGHYSDYLVVIEGDGTELTGGTILDAKTGDGGEVRGTKLEGATEHLLHKGDILFIPAGTAHQAIESAKQTLILFVIKAAVLADGNHSSPSGGPSPEPKVSKPGTGAMYP